MAEAIAVIGLIGSIVSIIDGIHKSKALWKEYIRSSASLRTELLPILGKLSAFSGILSGLQLQYELDQADANRLRTLEHIEEPLKASEQAIQSISARLNQIISLGRVSFAFGKVLNKEATAALHVLDQARPVLDLALTADQITLAKSIETYVRNIAADLRDFRAEGKSIYHDVKEQLNQIKARAMHDDEAQNKAEILAWISQTNYSSNYDAARQPSQWADTSGNWFLAGDEFQAWVTDRKHSRLLLTGISGSGKTVLCAKTIEYLAQRNAASGLKPTILYFFFDFNDAAKESVEGMVRALLAQLLFQMTGIPEDIQDLYDKHHEPTAPNPSVQIWVDLLSSHLKTLQDTFVFIDGLDECAEESYLSEMLIELFSAIDVRWLLTCRPSEKAIYDLVRAGFEHVSMDSKVIDRDIETYLSATLKADPKLVSFSKDARECIITEITSKSAGMFRYAQCQLEAILKLRDRRIKKVKSVLLAMPRTLVESYGRILTEAQQLDNWPIVERILLLASFSTRPVTIAEVSEFAILEDDMRSIDAEDRLDISDTLAAINTMVTVRDGIVTLAHKSVQDFFAEASEPFNMFDLWQNADVFIGKKCLQYLGILQEPVVNVTDIQSIKEPNTAQLRRLLQQYPFLDYAATCWQHHLEAKHQQLQALGHMASTLPLTTKPNLWKAWLMLQRADIWENQIQLAGVLCESFVRGALVTNWSLNFWKQRQQYRIRSDANPPNPAKALLSMSDKKTDAADESLHPQSFFWVRAIEAQSPIVGFSELLTFDKGDSILITSTGALWQGVCGYQSGWVDSKNVERCHTHTNHLLAGQLFHELAILLLEVSFQERLTGDAMMMWTQISSSAELSQYLAEIKGLIRRAESKMGPVYGNIIEYCLLNVYWADDKFKAVPDVVDTQNSCMEKVHAPLLAIRASGFRASRRPVKRNTYATIPNWRSRYGSYMSSTTSAPAHYAVTQPATTYRATSTEAQRVGSASVMSYRPNSTSAVAISYRMSHITSGSPYRPTSLSSTVMASSSPGPGLAAFATAVPVMGAVVEDITGETAAPAVATISQYDYLFTHLIESKDLYWKSPDLIYTLFPDQQARPHEVQPSDDEMIKILEAARESVLESRDWETKLAWASDVLAQVSVTEINNDRTAKALSMQIAPVYPTICQDATAIVNELADGDHAHAIYLRAKWWDFGWFGHDVNKIKALQQYKHAAEKGHVVALSKAAARLKAADPVRSHEYEIRAIDAASADALFNKALNIIEGNDGYDQDRQIGMDLILQAANVADMEAPEALYHAGLMFARESFFKDANTLPDFVRAVECFRKAAFYGSAKAQLRLGSAYELAQLGLPHSIPLALHYYILAARRGEAEAEMGISKITLHVGYGGDSTRPFDGAAYTYAKRATLDDFPIAVFAMGYFHETGLHVAVDKEKALEWYESAAALGYFEADERITKLKEAKKERNDDVSEEPSRTDDRNYTDSPATSLPVLSTTPSKPEDGIEPSQPPVNANDNNTKVGPLLESGVNRHKRRTWFRNIKTKFQTE